MSLGDLHARWPLHGRWGWKPREVERAIEVVRKAGFAIIGVKITAAGDIDIATGPASNNEIRTARPPAIARIAPMNITTDEFDEIGRRVRCSKTRRDRGPSCRGNGRDDFEGSRCVRAGCRRGE